MAKIALRQTTEQVSIAQDIHRELHKMQVGEHGFAFFWPFRLPRSPNAVHAIRLVLSLTDSSADVNFC